MHKNLVALVLVTALSSCSALWDESPSPAPQPQETAASESGTSASGSQIAETPEKKTPETEGWKILAAEAFASGGIEGCSAAWAASGACVAEYRKLEATYGFNPRSCLKLADAKAAEECRTIGDAYVESFATGFSQCRKITTPEGRLRCSDRLSLDNASKADLSACDALRTDEMKKSCADGHYLRMAESGTGWTLVCRKISNATVRSACERARFEAPKN